jgi:hypothetical protein
MQCSLILLHYLLFDQNVIFSHHFVVSLHIALNNMARWFCAVNDSELFLTSECGAHTVAEAVGIFCISHVDYGGHT